VVHYTAALEKVEQERAVIQNKVSKAIPLQQEANKALEKIKPSDINELRGMRCMTDTGRLVFDALELVFSKPMVHTSPDTLTMLKMDTPFYRSSFEEHSVKLLQANTLALMIEFDKNTINDETLELLEPYFKLKTADNRLLFTPENAKKASAALAGMVTWIQGLVKYAELAKIVNPVVRSL